MSSRVSKSILYSYEVTDVIDIPAWVTSVSNDVDCPLARFKSFGGLVSVGGRVNLTSVKGLAAIDGIKRIGGDLVLSGTECTSLGNLELIGRDLIISLDTPLVCLGRLGINSVAGEVCYLDSTGFHGVAWNVFFTEFNSVKFHLRNNPEDCPRWAVGARYGWQRALAREVLG